MLASARTRDAARPRIARSAHDGDAARAAAAGTATAASQPIARGLSRLLLALLLLPALSACALSAAPRDAVPTRTEAAPSRTDGAEASRRTEVGSRREATAPRRDAGATAGGATAAEAATGGAATGGPASGTPSTSSTAAPGPTRAAAGSKNAATPPRLDTHCRVNADCAVKNVGNCCGEYPACVNVDSTTDPAAVQAACRASGRLSVCGFRSISACTCERGTCQSADEPAIGVRNGALPAPAR